MTHKKLVYLAGPYTAPTQIDQRINIGRLYVHYYDLVARGFNVLCMPFASAGLERSPMHMHMPHQEWIELCKRWLLSCDEMYIVPHTEESAGTMLEIQYAKYVGIPYVELPMLDHHRAMAIMQALLTMTMDISAFPECGVQYILKTYNL